MSDSNGLQEALTTVLNTQASMQQTTALLQQAMVEFAQRFTRVESELAAIRTILMHHEELLQGLPEALQRRIGFQGPVQQP